VLVGTLCVGLLVVVPWRDVVCAVPVGVCARGVAGGLWNCGLLGQSRRFAPRGTCAGPPLWLGEKGSVGAHASPARGRRSPEAAGANFNRSVC
jgi:hypothetical protein